MIKRQHTVWQSQWLTHRNSDTGHLVLTRCEGLVWCGIIGWQLWSLCQVVRGRFFTCSRKCPIRCANVFSYGSGLTGGQSSVFTSVISDRVLSSSGLELASGDNFDLDLPASTSQELGLQVCTISHPVYLALRIKPRDSGTLVKHSTNLARSPTPLVFFHKWNYIQAKAKFPLFSYLFSTCQLLWNK